MVILGRERPGSGMVILGRERPGSGMVILGRERPGSIWLFWDVNDQDRFGYFGT